MAQNIEPEGQVSLSGTVYNQNTSTQLNGGIRLIPGLRIVKNFENENILDLYISVNAFIYKTNSDLFFDLDLYRIKLRYAGKQFEIRAGLQKLYVHSSGLILLTQQIR